VAAESDLWQQGTVVDDEAHNTTTTRPITSRPGFIAERRESALVVAYREYLTATGDARQQKRLRSVVRFSDLYLLPAGTDGPCELVEAKRDSSHGKVREALAQLLDYAAHATCATDALTALFLSAPMQRDIQWLASYGIGRTYRDDLGAFFHHSPPDEAVARMRTGWQLPCPG
jgi:hypothetical protein